MDRLHFAAGVAEKSTWFPCIQRLKEIRAGWVAQLFATNVAGEPGAVHRTHQTVAGSGVLIYDPDNTGEITEKRQYVFTECDPTANNDMEALRAVFDSNGDGVLDASDAAFANFKMLVSNADGSTTAQALSQLNITSINLTAEATNIELPDGLVVTGENTFRCDDGSAISVAVPDERLHEFTEPSPQSNSWCRHGKWPNIPPIPKAHNEQSFRELATC